MVNCKVDWALRSNRAKTRKQDVAVRLRSLSEPRSLSRGIVSHRDVMLETSVNLVGLHGNGAYDSLVENFLLFTRDFFLQDATDGS
jgi:hypothetical protein